MVFRQFPTYYVENLNILLMEGWVHQFYKDIHGAYRINPNYLSDFSSFKFVSEKTQQLLRFYTDSLNLVHMSIIFFIKFIKTFFFYLPGNPGKSTIHPFCFI